MKAGVILVFGALAFAMPLGSLFFGLRRSEEKIKPSLLELAPLGSNPDTVLAVVKHQGWKTDGYRANTGFYKQEPKTKPEVVGVSSVQASLGDFYTFPFGSTNVSAFWGFDKDRRLIEIWVWKTTDSI
jgi:hypothetical protein